MLLTAKYMFVISYYLSFVFAFFRCTSSCHLFVWFVFAFAALKFSY